MFPSSDCNLSRQQSIFDLQIGSEVNPDCRSEFSSYPDLIGFSRIQEIPRNW